MIFKTRYIIKNWKWIIFYVSGVESRVNSSSAFIDDSNENVKFVNISEDSSAKVKLTEEQRHVFLLKTLFYIENSIYEIPQSVQ